ncbi:MAG: hypothetical protein H6Q69_3828 [Firmicutes bacterium]|nr:hypothetical protein [Bacillota bacterium]
MFKLQSRENQSLFKLLETIIVQYIKYKKWELILC